MSPRGYFTREYINPYFTSEGYKHTDRYKEEIASMDRLEKKAEAILTYPAKIAKRVWYWILFKTGYLKG
jgi:hypothetical protein